MWQAISSCHIASNASDNTDSCLSCCMISSLARRDAGVCLTSVDYFGRLTELLQYGGWGWQRLHDFGLAPKNVNCPSLLGLTVGLDCR